MPTECNPTLFDFARVQGRAIVASFDGGRITSDAARCCWGLSSSGTENLHKRHTSWFLNKPGFDGKCLRYSKST